MVNDFINNLCFNFQVITSTLWDNLSDPMLDSNQISSLLYQLHQCLSSGIVETVIGHRVANSHVEWSTAEYSTEHNKTYINLQPFKPSRLHDYKSDRLADMKAMCTAPTQTIFDCNEHLTESESERFKKFELLWEYGRDSQCTSSRGFEKTLLKVFDHLALPYHVSIRTFVTKWLQESMLRGDLNRLLRPLLKMILSSGTKRLSVVHAQQNSSRQDSDITAAGDETDGEVSLDKDVYAISSEDGNIKYHIETTRYPKVPSPIRSLQKKFFGVTYGNKNNKTSNYISDKCVTASPTEISPFSLIVNPMDNSSDVEAFESVGSSGPASVGDNIVSATNTNLRNLKEEDYSSCEEETDESYSEESDSEQREESMERDNSLPPQNTVDIKRFSGVCEHVTERLSEHDRTKNGKTYQVSSL